MLKVDVNLKSFIEKIIKRKILFFGLLGCFVIKDIIKIIMIIMIEKVIFLVSSLF